MKKSLINIANAIRELINRAIEMSSFEYFDDDDSQGELDQYYCSFVFETA